MTVPGALEIIRDAAAQLKDSDVFIGAGTVLDAPTARAAIIAGAQFVVGPGVRRRNREALQFLRRRRDARRAARPPRSSRRGRAGPTSSRSFPADIGGPDYLKTIKEPLPQVELLPTKGVDFDTAAAYIKAGAIAVGAGSSLVNKALIAAKHYARITENAAAVGPDRPRSEGRQIA